jgi:hypothetical protein
LAEYNLENKDVNQSKEFIERALDLYPHIEGYKKFFAKIKSLERRKRKKIIIGIIVAVFAVIIALGAVWTTFYLIERNHWDKAKQENSYNAFSKYLTEYPDGRFVKEARILIAKADSIEIDSIAGAILMHVPYTNDCRLKMDSKVEDVLKTIGKKDDILPLKDGVTSFSVNLPKASDNFGISTIYEFTSNIKEPERHITGKNWYGEPTYAIAGYVISQKALLKDIQIEINLITKYAGKTANILYAMCPKIEKQGYADYSGKQQDNNIKIFLNESLTIIISKNDDQILKINLYNTNSESFVNLLEKVKTGKLN